MDHYIERLQAAIASSIRGISQQELLCKPEGKWCIAEVLEHLYLTYTGTIKGCQRCLGDGKPLATPQSLKQRLNAFVVITYGYLPTGIKANERIQPKGMPAEQVVQTIIQQITKMDESIAQCESRFGAKAKLMNHPVLGGLTGKQWRKFHWVHGWHHVKQIQNLRTTNGKAPENTGA
jgi:hypothetical protein